MNSEPISKKELRNFGLLMAVVIACLFGIFFFFFFNTSIKIWPWGLAGLFVVSALLYPQSLRPVYSGWMRFGHVLGWINTRILLGVVFYLIFLPMGFMMRLLGKDPLTRKLDDKQLSYRKMRDHKIKSDDMEKPF